MYLTSTVLVANSTPIVDFDSNKNSFRVNRLSKLLLPEKKTQVEALSYKLRIK